MYHGKMANSRIQVTYTRSLTTRRRHQEKQPSSLYGKSDVTDVRSRERKRGGGLEPLDPSVLLLAPPETIAPSYPVSNDQSGGPLKRERDAKRGVRDTQRIPARHQKTRRRERSHQTSGVDVRPPEDFDQTNVPLGLEASPPDLSGLTPSDLAKKNIGLTTPEPFVKDTGFGGQPAVFEGQPASLQQSRGIKVSVVSIGPQVKKEFVWKEEPWMYVRTALSEAHLLVWKFQGREALSQIGHFEVIASSPKPDLDLVSLVGGPIVVSIDFKKQKRYFHGYCSMAQQIDPLPQGTGEQYFYKICFNPILWFLRFSKHYRIFQEKTALDVIQEVLRLLGIKNVKTTAKKKGTGKRDYCVQYGESNYDFIQRLMEEEGLFYHVEHTKKGHTIIITDQQSYYTDVPLESTIPIRGSLAETTFSRSIFTARLQEETVPSRYFLADYNMTTPQAKLTTLSEGKGAGGQIYHFPAGIDAEDVVKKNTMAAFGDIWLDGLEIPQSQLSGQSNVPFFEPGRKFTLTGHDRKSANKDYALREVTHQAVWHPEERKENVYENTYNAFDAKTLFVPAKAIDKKRIYGAQTAVVIGPEDEEIHTDQHGRIKVKFFWDQSEEEDKITTCWMRVVQSMAGSGWGCLFLPRVGQEVLVTFLDGDPNRPLVTGAVYNGSNMPPYLPDEKTKSTIKTQSYQDKRDEKGFNELRFEDKAEKEEVYLHVQKDWNTVVEDNRDTHTKQPSATS